MNCRWRIRKELASLQNQIQRWLKIYFPEHSKVFGRFTGTGNMELLHSAPFPSDLISLGVEGISGIWKQMKLCGIGRKRAQRIYEAAQTSVGCTTGMEAARMELQILLEDYDAKLQQYERVMQVVENLSSRISAVAELLKIQGLGLATVAGLFAEIGDIRRLNLLAKSKNWLALPLLKTVPVSTKDRQRSAGEEDRDEDRDLEQSCFGQ